MIILQSDPKTANILQNKEEKSKKTLDKSKISRYNIVCRIFEYTRSVRITYFEVISDEA